MFVATYWVQNNHIGTPVRMTDGDGQVVWKTWHTPFGETVGLDEDQALFPSKPAGESD